MKSGDKIVGIVILVIVIIALSVTSIYKTSYFYNKYLTTLGRYRNINTVVKMNINIE